MRRLIATTAALTLALALAGQASAQGITGTAHDLSGAAWNTSGEICIVCHTPHSATNYTDGPLWDHAATTTAFALYNDPNGTIDGAFVATDVVTDGTASKLCLSCHDGTIGIDDFGGSGGTSQYITTGDLSTNGGADDHPIGIVYDDAADTGLNPTTTALGASGTIADYLISSRVECSTCHDVHNAAGINKFLRQANTTSDLCLVCHNK